MSRNEKRFLFLATSSSTLNEEKIYEILVSLFVKQSRKIIKNDALKFFQMES